jgi:hypothetical protein
MEPRTRQGDDPEQVERFWAARHEGRGRTILYAAIVAGLVSLFIARVSEVQVYNDQVDRNRKNCQLVQEDRKAVGEFYDRQADNVLGDAREGIKPIKIKGTAFEDFGPLIVAQARENRRRADLTLQRVEDCAVVHPKRDFI